MAASILFSQDNVPSYPTQRHTPQLLHLTTPNTASVDHWLSQQHTHRSTTHLPLYDMPSFDDAFSQSNQPTQSNQVCEDILNDYTFTTEHHQSEDEFAQWNASPHFPMTLGLHLDTQPVLQQSRLSSSTTYQEPWNNYPFNSSSGHNSSSAGYLLSPSYSDSTNLSPFSVSGTSLPQASPIGSNLSLSPLYAMSPQLPSPSTPGSAHQTLAPSPTLSAKSNQPSPDVRNPQSLPDDTNSPPLQSDKACYTHRQQVVLFREALGFPLDNAGPFVPQPMYKPHTTSDRKRYVEEVLLEPPLYFISEHSGQYGISLKDALQLRTKKLVDREMVVFQGRGPSVSIRLEWPGYRQWSRQIPTKDFRSPPQPITLAKLAKNVAKCVQRFMTDRKNLPMEDDADRRWKIGDGPNDIKLDDLVLVSIHHVSLGSWQPHLRLVRPRPEFGAGRARQIVLPPTPMTATNTVPPINFNINHAL